MLTDEEKAVARAFRASAQAELLRSVERDCPVYIAPNFIATYRHLCDALNGRSVALTLQEHYELSPASGGVPEGRFAFLWREGRCPHCRKAARSITGRLVIAKDRPPLSERRPISRIDKRTPEGPS